MINPGGTLSEGMFVSVGVSCVGRVGRFAYLGLREGKEEQEEGLDFPIERKPDRFHRMSGGEQIEDGHVCLWD